MNRWIRSIAAVVMLAVLIVGVPLLLVRLAGWPLPSMTPNVSDMATRVRQGNIPSDVVINTLAVIVWLAWLQLIWSVLWEAIVNVPSLSSGRRWRPPPLVLSPVGDGVAKLFSLILAVGVLTTASPGVATALSTPSGLGVEQAPSSLDINAADTNASLRQSTQAASTPQWVVTPGDDLWSIAEHALGDGSLVDEIMDLNPGLSARSLRAGTVINLPAGARTLTPQVQQSLPDTPTETTQPDTGSVARYVVQENDGPWDVAEALLGDGSRHVELHDLFAGQEVAPGVVFTTDTFVIHAGWVFELDSTPQANDTDVPTEHAVVRGESLSSIAAAELGDQNRWPEIFDLNAGEVMEGGQVFDDPNIIQPGWVLDLPSPDGSDAVETPAIEAPVVGLGETGAELDEAEIVDVDVVEVVAVAVDETEVALPDSTVPVAVGAVPAAATAPGSAVERSAPATASAGLDSVRDVRPVWMLGITGATALATALWALVRARRRRMAVRGGGRLRDYDSSSMLIDEALRAAADPDLVDWANRSLGELVAAYGINDSGAVPVVVELSRTDGLTVHWDPPQTGVVPEHWTIDGDSRWSLRFDASSTDHGVVPAAIPGLVTIGGANGAHVLVDLESCGSLTVTGDLGNAEALVRSMILELGADSALSNAHVHTVGLDIDGTEHLQRVRVRREADAIEHLRSIRVQHDHVLNAANRASMLEVRAASSPLGREVTVVAVRASSCVRLDELIEAAAPQRGVALIVVGDAPCAASLDIDGDATATLSPHGIVVGANGLSRQAASTLAVHLDRVNNDLQTDRLAVPAAVESGGSDPWIEPTRLVRVLGVPVVDGLDGLARNELELLAFVASAGGKATDDEIADGMSCSRLSRSDVWATVGAIRAEDGGLLAPRDEGGNAVALTDGCLSDVDWMSRLAFRSHTRDDIDAADDLIDALELVRGVPYDATSGFGWVTTTGAFGRALEMIERTGYLLAARATDAGMVTQACTALREVIEQVGPNEPLTQALMRLEQASGNTEGAEAAYGDFSQELAFLGDGPDPVLPGSGTTALLSRSIEIAELKADLEPAVLDDVVEVGRETMRPQIVLRTFGEVCAEGASATQALAVVFAVAAANRPLTGEDLAEATGYSVKSLSTVFTQSHEILERNDGELRLRDGVWTDHGWLAECARRAAQADEDGDVYEVKEWLHTLFAEVNRIDGAAFETPPGKKTYWSWVDDFPASLSARSIAETEMVNAVLSGMSVWHTAAADEQIPAEVVVRAACNLANLAPYAAVAQSLRPGDSHSGGECLIRAAHAAAAGRAELTSSVIAEARQLVAAGKLDASNELAEALGL